MLEKAKKIPLLKELINLIKNKNIKIFIEIKEPETEKEILKLIEKNKIQDKVVIVSFYAKVIKKVRQLSNIKTGFIFSRLKPNPIAIASKADIVLPHYRLVTKKLIKEAHNKKLEVIAWTVDDKKLAFNLVSFGIDGIATNKPDLLK